METGFYWVGNGVTAPYVWFWQLGYGFHRPSGTLPITMPHFKAAGLSVLSDKLTLTDIKKGF
ncbi:hypothetical protein [Candidatus Pantoea multigeneris]|uniref:Uncharacterized protein n=1 Tax=Candidatus Pantoea multigeneris TaxID=2608357 RepID=A0ABX0RI41_9GAMM|nr:hypothetical protein [Pantoea multigeneris]NIF23069.1 hypothetical protein [Pantoea multigeneris]